MATKKSKVCKTAVCEKKAEVKSVKKDVEFSVYSPESKSVELAGSFNGWKPAKMKRSKDGIWTVKVSLASGSYQYKFVFDGSWEVDSANPERIPDGQGGENSVKNV